MPRPRRKRLWFTNRKRLTMKNHQTEDDSDDDDGDSLASSDGEVEIVLQGQRTSMSIKTYKATDVLNETNPDDEELPEFELEGCMFQKAQDYENGVQKPVSILSVPKGEIIIGTGTLIADEDFSNYLTMHYDQTTGKSITYNNVHVEMQCSGAISFAVNEVTQATTLWVGSSSKWFELAPSELYKPTYDRMLHVIGLYWENMKGSDLTGYESVSISERVALAVCDVLTRYAASKMGSTMSVRDLAQIVMEPQHSLFLIDQMNRKHPKYRRDPPWNALYLLLSNPRGYESALNRLLEEMEEAAVLYGKDPPVSVPNLADLHIDAMDLDEVEDAMRPPPILPPGSRRATQTAISTTPILQPGYSRAVQARAVSSKLNPVLPATQAPGNNNPKLGSEAAYHGPYTSSMYPNGADKFPDVVTTVVIIALHAIESGRRSSDKLTIASVASMIYYDMSLHFRPGIVEYLRLRSKDILARLPPVFKKTPMWQELEEEIKKPSKCLIPNHSDEKKHIGARDMVEKLKSGQVGFVRRDPSKSTHRKRTAEATPTQAGPSLASRRDSPAAGPGPATWRGLTITGDLGRAATTTRTRVNVTSTDRSAQDTPTPPAPVIGVPRIKRSGYGF